MASKETVHVPVMVHEIIEQMALEPSLTIVDGTVGGGGHSSQLLKIMPDDCRLIGIDRDRGMLERASSRVAGPQVSLHRASYAELDSVLDELQIVHVDRILLDLGLSSDQLADPDRGFGFETTGRLDMRFHDEAGTSAAELLATLDETHLRAIFKDFGDEAAAPALAREIIRQRQQGRPVQTAQQFLQVIESLPSIRKGASHPAARIFQALRIAVNRELEELQTALQDVFPRRLRSGGRVLVLTFHSLEDRLVKQAFREVNTWDNLTRKPITATASEVRWNPRSRSAKLRVAARR